MLTLKTFIMKFLNIRTCLYLILSVTVLACSSEHFDKNKKDKGELPISNEWSDTPYKLNVVYFVPQGIDTVEGYEKRISDILLDFQEFTASNMEREGFGRKSFGLAMKNPVKIDITTIEGEGGKEAYPYSGGGGTIINELDDYFNEYPDEKYSEHTLVIVPSTSGDPMNPGGVPFYGLGKYCFALDYEEMKAKHLLESPES